MLDQFDDDPDAEFPVASVPPSPSVTPRSAPPPPDSVVDEPTDQRGCLVLLAIGGAVAVLALLALVALVIVGVKFFGDDTSNEKALQDVFIQTGIASASTDAVHPPQRDLRLGACEGDGNGGVRASGTVTNWTERPADYAIDVSFRRSGGDSSGEEFASRIVLVDAVAAHATVNWQAVVDQSPDGAFSCRVVAINRWRAGTRPAS